MITIAADLAPFALGACLRDLDGAAVGGIGCAEGPYGAGLRAALDLDYGA
jgi:hypothetical protein